MWQVIEDDALQTPDQENHEDQAKDKAADDDIEARITRRRDLDAALAELSAEREKAPKACQVRRFNTAVQCSFQTIQVLSLTVTRHVNLPSYFTLHPLPDPLNLPSLCSTPSMTRPTSRKQLAADWLQGMYPMEFEPVRERMDRRLLSSPPTSC